MRILIAAGSSGGHIFPAIATAFKLKELDGKSEIFFVGSKKDLDTGILKNEGYNFDTISSNKKIFKDLCRAFSILKRFRPDIAVGFGGYVSFPTLMMAKLMGAATVIHEQNLIPGLANRVLSNIADKIGISFRESCAFFLRKSKIRETGNPIRGSLVKLRKDKALEIFDLDKECFTVLVMGGSQGAHFINDAVLEMLGTMSDKEKSYLQFIHLCGLKDFEFVKSAYGLIGVKARQFSFCDRMSEAYSASDLIISRAGATSIAEITFFGLPAIVIPYPALRVHQIENARFLEDKTAAIVIRQEDLSPGYLKEIVLSLVRDRYKLKLIAESASRLSVPDAADRLAREIIDVGKR